MVKSGVPKFSGSSGVGGIHLQMYTNEAHARVLQWHQNQSFVSLYVSSYKFPTWNMPQNLHVAHEQWMESPGRHDPHFDFVLWIASSQFKNWSFRKTCKSKIQDTNNDLVPCWEVRHHFCLLPMREEGYLQKIHFSRFSQFFFSIKYKVYNVSYILHSLLLVVNPLAFYSHWNLELQVSHHILWFSPESTSYLIIVVRYACCMHILAPLSHV